MPNSPAERRQGVRETLLSAGLCRLNYMCLELFLVNQQHVSLFTLRQRNSAVYDSGHCSRRRAPSAYEHMQECRGGACVYKCMCVSASVYRRVRRATCTPAAPLRKEEAVSLLRLFHSLSRLWFTDDSKCFAPDKHVGLYSANKDPGPARLTDPHDRK